MSLHRWILLSLLLAVAAPARGGAAFSEQSFALELDSGRALDVRIRRPQGMAADRALPTLVVFGGFQGGDQVLDIIPITSPLNLVSFDYPFDPPRQFIFPASLRYLPAFRQAVTDMFDGIEKLRPALAARPDVDGARITVVGASAGAPFATIGGARGHYPGVIIVQGFGQLREVIARQFVLDWDADYGTWVRHPADWLASLCVWLLGLPAPESEARQFRADQRILMLDASNDERIPASAANALWAAIEASPAQATREIMAGGHLRGRKDKRLDEILQRGLGWLYEIGLAGP